MASPVGLVTGASSGIGLALTKHLLEQKWNVAMLDISPLPASLNDAPNILYIKTDVSDWAQLSAAFDQTFKWHGRLDFCALNAGIDDRDDIFNSIGPDPPYKPNMKTFEINLFAPYYGLKLAAHYMAQNTPVAGGKVVITASAAGLFARSIIPQYSSAKYGLVGLTRALAPPAQKVGMTLNAICPAMVVTGLPPPGLMDEVSDDQITPMSTILRAFDELVDFQNVGEREKWVKSGHNGQTVEANLDQLYYREEQKRAENPAKAYLNERVQDAWVNVYTARNRKFGLTDWEKHLGRVE